MNMKKTALLLLILLGWSIRPLRAQQPQVECWMDSQGLWAWGFADRFAVYGNRPWQYESDRKDGDRRILTLRHGDERLRAELRPTSDTTCTIAVDGGRPQTYRRWDPARGIHSYLPADGTPPAPCDYQTDTATIRGYIPNARHLCFEVSHYDALDYINRNEVSAQTDSAGFFEIRLPLSGRSQVFLLQPQRFIHELWLSPGETVFFSFLDGTPYIMSKDSRLELEMSQVPIDAFSAYPRSIQYPHEPDDSTALSEIRKAIAQCDARLDSMTAAHPNLSAIFRQTAKELIGYSALQGLGEQMFETCVEGREQTHPGITQLIDSLLASLPATPTFISDYYDSFWNWHTVYQDYLANRHGRITLNAGLLRKVLDRQNDFRMPDSIALLFDQIETLKNELANDKALQMKYDSLHSQVYEALEQIPEFKKNALEYLKITTLQSYWNIFDTLPLPEAQKDYVKARSTMEALRQSHTPLPQYVFDEAMRRVRTPGLRDILARQQEVYQPADFDYQGSLRTNDIVAGLTDGGEILRRILAPYRGKVVYTDIWGTWCGPCKHDMKLFAPAAKEALKGRDVVFLYFANRSSDASWKQIIKEYGCVGPQTVHYNLPAEQQEAVERILLNRGYPSYALFDKEGKLVTKDAPRPSEKDRLVRTIEGLLRQPAATTAQP